jgi:methionyl-tRNA formyltransferase
MTEKHLSYILESISMNERILFWGRNKNYRITHLCFNELIKFVKNTQHKIVLTVVSDDHHGDPDSLEALADKNDIPWTSVSSNEVNDSVFISRIAGLHPTMCITVQFPKIFSEELINIPSRANLNMHRGWPLRGAAIDERAIINKLDTYNIILHHISTGIDTGNIIGKAGFQLKDDEDGYSLVKKADSTGLKLFANNLLQLIGKKIPEGEKQVIENTIYGSKVSISNKIDFADSSWKIERLCRAFNHPRKLGAQKEINNQKIFIMPPVKIIPESHKENPGTILFLENSSAIITTGDYKISFSKCHLEDKKTILFGQFLIENGFTTGDNLR